MTEMRNEIQRKISDALNELRQEKYSRHPELNEIMDDHTNPNLTLTLT